MGSSFKKIKKHFLFFTLKKLKTAFWRKLENEALSKRLFCVIAIDKSYISLGVGI
jgi:hypothetical protein